MRPSIDLLSVYRPVPGTRIHRMIISLEGGHLLSGHKITDKVQRAAVHRLFKRMTRMNIIRLDVGRWVTTK